MAVLLLTNFLSLEVRSCDIVHVTAVAAKDCLRATDHVPTGSVTQRSITLAYNGLHLPHSRTNTATSRKAEHEQSVYARVKSTCLDMLDADRSPNAVSVHAGTSQVDFEVDCPPPARSTRRSFDHHGKGNGNFVSKIVSKNEKKSYLSLI